MVSQFKMVFWRIWKLFSIIMSLSSVFLCLSQLKVDLDLRDGIVHSLFFRLYIYVYTVHQSETGGVKDRTRCIIIILLFN